MTTHDVQLVAQLPDGRYLLMSGSQSRTGRETWFLAIFHPTRGLERRLTLSVPEGGVRLMKLSPSGRWLAISDTHTPRDQQEFKVKDLVSGDERVVASFPLKPFHLREDHVGLLGWLSTP